MSRKQKVSVYLRIRLDGKQRYCPAVWASKNRLKDHCCLVDGVEEYRPDGVYHLRYRVNGKQVWESVDLVQCASLRAQRIDQIAHPNTSTSRGFTERHKPAPAKEEVRHRLDDEVHVPVERGEAVEPNPCGVQTDTQTVPAIMQQDLRRSDQEVDRHA